MYQNIILGFRYRYTYRLRNEYTGIYHCSRDEHLSHTHTFTHLHTHIHTYTRTPTHTQSPKTNLPTPSSASFADLRSGLARFFLRAFPSKANEGARLCVSMGT